MSSFFRRDRHEAAAARVFHGRLKIKRAFRLFNGLARHAVCIDHGSPDVAMTEKCLGSPDIVALRETVGSLRDAGLLEAEKVIHESQTLYKYVRDWAREVTTKQRGKTLQVYNDDWALTDKELHSMASQLEREGFRVSDGSSHPGENRYRGFWVRHEGE